MSADIFCYYQISVQTSQHAGDISLNIPLMINEVNCLSKYTVADADCTSNLSHSFCINLQLLEMIKPLIILLFIILPM